jgi:hypothetical protein
MPKPVIPSALTSFVICGVLVLLAAAIKARRNDEPGEAGASDHFPKVDAASQQARLAYWTQTLATLDSIPFDELSREEKASRHAALLRRAHRQYASGTGARFYGAARIGTRA